MTNETKYPETITADLLPKWAHISDAEIARDISDTEAEIANYERLAAAEEEIARVHPSARERRLAEFRASVRPSQISERRAFVAFLRRVQAARAAAAEREAMA